jgi:hypothetical protein
MAGENSPRRSPSTSVLHVMTSNDEPVDARVCFSEVVPNPIPVVTLRRVPCRLGDGATLGGGDITELARGVAAILNAHANG